MPQSTSRSPAPSTPSGTPDWPAPAPDDGSQPPSSMRTMLAAPRRQLLVRTMSAKSSVYTRTGDKGTTSLYNGTRCSKMDGVFEALGDVDELNAAVGVARYRKPGEKVEQLLVEVQSRLLDVGSHIATPLPTSSATQLERTRFDAEAIERVEKWIDALDEKLPPLTNFILPGGGEAACALHVARTVCRRAERRVVALVHEEQCHDTVARYMNRLSDFFFVAARYAAHESGEEETVYKKQ